MKITPSYLRGNFKVIEMFSNVFINDILKDDKDKETAKEYINVIKDKIERISNYFSEVDYSPKDLKTDAIFEPNSVLVEDIYYNLNKEEIDKEYNEYNKLVDELIDFIKSRKS